MKAEKFFFEIDEIESYTMCLILFHNFLSIILKIRKNGLLTPFFFGTEIDNFYFSTKTSRQTFFEKKQFAGDFRNRFYSGGKRKCRSRTL